MANCIRRWHHDTGNYIVAPADGVCTSFSVRLLGSKAEKLELELLYQSPSEVGSLSVGSVPECSHTTPISNEELMRSSWDE